MSGDPVAKGMSRMWAQWRGGLRPLSHAGVPAHAGRGERRELVTANAVVLFSIVVTAPDALNYLSFRTIATREAAITASLAVVAYLIAYALIWFGHRFAGILLFTSAVLANLAALTIIFGTKCLSGPVTHGVARDPRSDPGE